ncbi:MAG: methyltransferase domain-containing protein [bacterium]|nr:methyltransferase domain-containing protein [bacterium]
MQTAKTVAVKVTHSPFAHPARNVGALGITPGMKVADFGSGGGAYTLAIAESLTNSGHVYAIDVQRDLLRKTKNEAHKRGYKNVEIIWGDLEYAGAAKIADGALDVVLISNLLFQINDKNAVLAEARRVLKPSGRLVIIDWSDSFGGMGPQEVDVVTKEATESLALSCGFEHVREFPAGSHHYGLVFRKK